MTDDQKRPVGRASKRTPERVRGILEAIESGMNVRGACKANGISIVTWITWRRNDPALDRAHHAAVAERDK